MTTVILDSGGLSAWARRTPPVTLLTELEAAQRADGIVVVPTITVVESTTGDGSRDAAVNRRVKFATAASLDLPLARVAASLRATVSDAVSAADAVVVATATRHPEPVVITSDPDDLRALCAASEVPVRVVAV